MEEAKTTRTLEYINDCVRNNYRHDPTYTERKIRNPFKVALKIYSDIPDDIEMKQTLKSELDTIADELGNQPPEMWGVIWIRFGDSFARHFPTTSIPPWAETGLDRFTGKLNDPDDYSS